MSNLQIACATRADTTSDTPFAQLPLPTKVRVILQEVSSAENVPVRAILIRSNYPKDVRARHIAMARCRAEIKIKSRPISYERIGAWFDRNHASVIHACRRVASWAE